MKKRFVLIRAVLLFAIVFATSFGFVSWQLRSQKNQAPLSPSQTADSRFPADDLGRKLALDKPAQRVAVIGPGATEVLFYLGLENRLVGRDQISDFPQNALKVPIIGNFTGPFLEKIIATRPDLLIMQGETWDAARIDTYQEKMGIPVAALTATTLREEAEDIRKMGAWLGEREKANALAVQLETAVQTAPPQKLSAFIQISNPPLWTAGTGTLVSDVIEQSGFTNIAAVAGYKQFSAESLLADDPDVYIVPDGSEDAAKVLSGLRANPQLAQLSAVRKGRVIVLDGDLLLRPGPRLLDGIDKLRAAAEKIQREMRSKNTN